MLLKQNEDLFFQVQKKEYFKTKRKKIKTKKSVVKTRLRFYLMYYLFLLRNDFHLYVEHFDYPLDDEMGCYDVQKVCDLGY